MSVSSLLRIAKNEAFELLAGEGCKRLVDLPQRRFAPVSRAKFLFKRKRLLRVRICSAIQKI